MKETNIRHDIYYIYTSTTACLCLTGGAGWLVAGASVVVPPVWPVRAEGRDGGGTLMLAVSVHISVIYIYTHGASMYIL